MLDKDRSMAHPTMGSGLLGMVDRLGEVIVLRQSGLDGEQENCGSGHQADVQSAVHGDFLVTGQNSAAGERTAVPS
jgi:hypothetical protein